VHTSARRRTTNAILLHKQQLARLSALRPPSAGRKVVGEFVAANAGEIQTLERLGSAIDDDAVLRAASASRRLAEVAGSGYRPRGSYGVTVCGILAG
jgi:hypothetical protein